jgi:hypothetical protein
VVEQTAKNPQIDAVVTSDFSNSYARDTPNASQDEIERDYEKTFRLWQSAGKAVVVIPATPLTGGSVPECIQEHPTTAVDPCSNPRTRAVVPDPLASAAQAVHASTAAGVSPLEVLDLTDLFCDQTTCHTVVGGLVLYIDSNHLTSAFVRSAAPLFEPDLTALQQSASSAKSVATSAASE